jgi:hypothetical protein
MKVFMSWSGGRSKAAAELLHDWVKCVIQASRPWISTRGIGRGSVWFTEINNELKDTTVGIICLTHQNKNSPWILFEAGALAKGLTTNKVCTFLVDLVPSDIQDPLAQFNHTLPTREGMMSLAATLNSSLDVPLDNATLTSVFEAFWPQLEKDYEALLAQYPQEVVVEARSEGSILEEILESTRGLTQRLRVIEERQNDISVTWSNDRLQEKWYNSSPYSKVSLNEGLKLLTDCMKEGLRPEETLEILSKKIGRKTALYLLDHIAYNKIPAEVATKSTID